MSELEGEEGLLREILCFSLCLCFFLLAGTGSFWGKEESLGADDVRDPV